MSAGTRGSVRHTRKRINEGQRKKRSVPISSQIYATLRQRIIGKYYAKAGSLTPELMLMDEFKVSRHTIRTALQKLVADGLIERRPGTLTRIVERDPPAGTWAIGSLDEVFGQISYAGEILFAGPVPAKRYPGMARLFGVGLNDSLFQVVRVLRSAAGPAAHTTLFTRLEFGKTVPRHLISSKFFLPLIEEYCGIRAARARQTASAAIPPATARRVLKLDDKAPALVLQRTFWSGSGEPIEHIEMYCRPDIYKQEVEFYRDNRVDLEK